MLDPIARLERVRSRHPDATVVEPVSGRPALVRRDQILVAAPDVSAAEDRLRRWYDSRQDEDGVCLLRLRSPARVDVCEAAAQLCESGRHRRLTAAPNHLVHGMPLWWTGPADLPRPAGPLPPPSGRARRPVTVAVLDTGLGAHPWYEHTEWYAEQRAEVEEQADNDVDYASGDQTGHGTFVAGLVLRHAPTARIRAKRVIGPDGVGDELDMIRALTWLAAWGRADVVNVSAGCYTYDDRPSPPVARAVAMLGRRSAVLACAGNAGESRPFWPAALKQVLAVAALDGDDRAEFSNYGWWVDACAQGVGLTSCFTGFDGYASWSGTSFAAPAVAGAVAARVAEESLPVDAAVDRVLDPGAAPYLPDLGVVVRPGEALRNGTAAIG